MLVRLFFTIFTSLLVLCGSVRAETLHVPKDHATVQAAAAAAPGDLILVHGTGGRSAAERARCSWPRSL